MCKTFVSKHWHKATPKQQARMVEAFIFLTENRSGEIKAQKILGGNVQRNYINKDEASSPTAYMESVIMTAVIDAKERRDVATVDTSNNGQRHKTSNYCEATWSGVDILCEIAPEVYLKYVTTNK